jgi:hypothetical protein
MGKENAEVIIPDSKVAAVCCGYADTSGERKPCREIFAFDCELVEGKTPVYFICPECGYVNIGMELANKPTKIKNLKAKNYLECIAYTGSLSKDSIDAINDGSKKLYVDLFDTQFSRDEYIAQRGKDPAMPLLKKLKDNAIVDHHSSETAVTTGSDKVATVCCGYDDAGGVRKSCHESIEFDGGNVPATFECPECGCINTGMELAEGPKEIGNLKAENYLECIAYTGPLSKDAIGVIDDGSKKLYVDINGKAWSRDAYKKEYGRDPALHILERIKLQRIDDIVANDINSRRRRFKKYKKS